MEWTNGSAVLERSKEDGNCATPAGDGSSYLSNLTRQRLLTAEEEVALAHRAQNGDLKARDRLVEANMRLVVNIAKSYRSSSASLEDLVQEGSIGLIKAAERFDPAKGYRFSTYATLWIKQAISYAIDNTSRAIRIPAHVTDALRKVAKARESLTAELGEAPCMELIADRLGISVGEVKSLVHSAQEPVSLDMLVGQDEGTTLASLLIDYTSPNPEETVLSKECEQELRLLLSTLSANEREVVCKGTEIDEHSERPHTEGPKKPAVSRERLRQTQMLALRKMQIVAKRRAVYA